ncbi:MAG: zinc ribbon domain-containing protein [Candidatus Helarchaeota archaeon]|nr:zinc ribbon domain-containing protein [Candidatus Helarchaeota archaeon]
MGKKEKEFYLGTIKPKKVYDTIISLLKDAPADPYLKKRLRMIIASHTIISEIPFRAEIKARTTFSFSGTGMSNITCTIFSEGTKTYLTITSSMPSTLWDGRIHTRNIKRLHGELRFRLEAKDKSTVDEVLQPSEKIMENLSPIEFDGLELTSLITTSRIFLCRNKIIVREIAPFKIDNINLERERSKMWIYLAYSGSILIIPFIIMNIIFFIINPYSGPYYFPLTFFRISLPFILIGINMTILGLILSYQYFLVIQERGESINIYAKKKILNQLEEIIHHLKRQSPHLRYSLDKPVHLDEKEPLLSQSPTETKPCPLCGAKNRFTEEFCKVCGASL